MNLTLAVCIPGCRRYRALVGKAIQAVAAAQASADQAIAELARQMVSSVEVVLDGKVLVRASGVDWRDSFPAGRRS
jgi:hypothetical protein